MVLHTDLTDLTPSTGGTPDHAAQHNEVNQDVINLLVGPVGNAGGDLTGTYPNPTLLVDRIPKSVVTAIADLIVGTGNAAVSNLVVGADNLVLTADSTHAPSGLSWKDQRSLPQQVNTQTGTTYTLVLGDAGKLVTLNNAGAIALTVPPNSSVSFSIGSLLNLLQIGAGQVTLIPGSGVTITSAASLSLRAQSSIAGLVKTGTDTWYLFGDLSPLGEVINAQTGTTYTLALTDANELVTLSNGSAITLTVPTNASVAFPVGTRVDLAQIGAGQVTVAAAGGVTVNATPGLKLRAQYSAATLVQTAANTWLLLGDISS